MRVRENMAERPVHVLQSSTEKFRQQETAGAERRYGATGAFDYHIDCNTWTHIEDIPGETLRLHVEATSLKPQAPGGEGQAVLSNERVAKLDLPAFQERMGLSTAVVTKLDGASPLEKLQYQQRCCAYARENWLAVSQILDVIEAKRAESADLQKVAVQDRMAEVRQRIRVLDVGTGDGKMLAFLHQRGYPWSNLLGITAEDMRNKDVSAEAPFDPGCPDSSYWVRNVEELVQSRESKLVEAERFDLIVSWVTFCWLADPIATLVGLYNSWLKQGGCMLVGSLPFWVSAWSEEIPADLTSNRGIEQLPSEELEQLWLLAWIRYLRDAHGMQIEVIRDGFNGVYFWWLQHKPGSSQMPFSPALEYGEELEGSYSIAYVVNASILEVYRQEVFQDFVRQPGPFDLAPAVSLVLPATCRRTFDELVVLSADRRTALVLVADVAGARVQGFSASQEIKELVLEEKERKQLRRIHDEMQLHPRITEHPWLQWLREDLGKPPADLEEKMMTIGFTTIFEYLF
ncbi:unnamed protein product, partial [Effrenium voratum]